MQKILRITALSPYSLSCTNRLVWGRIRDALNKAQCFDQAGFVKGMSVDDHLFTLVLLCEVMNEYRLPLCLAAVDFQKAFDTVSHRGLWAALREQGIPESYIGVLIKLYNKQSGRVVTQVASRTFKIERGTKQGDPLSPSLFNAVLEKAMRTCKLKWKQKKYGISVRGESLTNLRFADDILLIAPTIYLSLIHI
eukprot:4079035-Karenia_brevis.AAC.1